MYHKLYQHRLLAPLCQKLDFLNYFVCIKRGSRYSYLLILPFRLQLVAHKKSSFFLRQYSLQLSVLATIPALTLQDTFGLSCFVSSIINLQQLRKSNVNASSFVWKAQGH